MNCRKCNEPIGKTAVAKGGRYFCSRDCRDSYDDSIPGQTKAARTSPAAIRRKLSTPSEGSISSNAAGILERRGVYHTRLQSGARPVGNKQGKIHYMKLCPIGTPDRMFADGLVTFLEIKRPGRDRSPEQVEVAEKLKSNGALVFTVDDFGQTEFVVAELEARAARIRAIGDAIREIQKDIDSAFTEKFGK